MIQVTFSILTNNHLVKESSISSVPHIKAPIRQNAFFAVRGAFLNSFLLAVSVLCAGYAPRGPCALATCCALCFVGAL